jgi:hypothetical protein
VWPPRSPHRSGGSILVNNAGAIFSYRHLTAEGLERTFALNHMAYFVLSHGLREPLLAAAPARVVNTASAAHQSAQLHFEDLQFARAYNGVSAYQRSKLCNILFTRELSRRWVGKGITVNCLHPGFVASRFGKESGGLLPFVLGAAQVFAISPEEGAETIVYLASSPDVVDLTGGYFFRCRATAPAHRPRTKAPQDGSGGRARSSPASNECRWANLRCRSRASGNPYSTGHVWGTIGPRLRVTTVRVCRANSSGRGRQSAAGVTADLDRPSPQQGVATA